MRVITEPAIPSEVREIAARLEENGFEAWCVGGALRDAALGLAHTDFDLATSARPEQVQALFPRSVPVGIKYGTVGVFDRKRRLHEVTTFRRDVTTDGRHAVVEYGASLDEDLARRDFTINALAYHPTTRQWRDPYHGFDDLAGQVLRAVGDPAARFREDYLRILRLIRFAARFEFTIAPDTWAAAQAAAPGLRQLSAERVRDEWFKSLRTARRVARLVSLWWESAAAAELLPELETPAAAAALPSLIDREPRDPVLLTVVLCRDAAAVLERLRASRAEIARAAAMAAGPGAPASAAPGDVRRWLSAVGPAADDLIALEQLRSGRPAWWAEAAASVRAAGDPLTRADLAVNGGELAAEGLARGPELGRLLQQLLDRVLEDPSLNTRDELFRLAREFGADEP